MKYILFDTREQAEEYRVKLQAHYDQTITDKKVVACTFHTWDNRPCLSIATDDYPDTDGEVVDSIDPPQEVEDE